MGYRTRTRASSAWNVLLLLLWSAAAVVSGFRSALPDAVFSSHRLSWRRWRPRVLFAESGQSPFAEKRVYHDSVIDRLWLYLFGIKMAEATNTPFDINPLTFSYDDFVRLSLLLNKGSPAMIKGSVLKVLKSIAFPGFAPIFRTLFPGDSQAACEFNAAVTPIFFSWLVGPARVEEGPILTRSGSVENWKSTVVIEKCRYLESTACKGTCASVCKVPTQEFFGDYLGLPVTMTPNFDNLQCVMRFGQQAPPIDEDTIQAERCFAECSTGQPQRTCPKIPRNTPFS